MRITKFMAAAMAAMTICSCTQQETINDQLPALSQGDTRINFQLTGGVTTYSTIEKEQMAHTFGAKLFKADGTELEMKNLQFNGSTFSATVASGTFADGDQANLFFHTNGENLEEGAGDTAKEKYEHSTVKTVLDRELTKGLPASLKTEVTLNQGTAVVTNKKATRVAARFEARMKAGSGSISGFKVELKNVNIESGKLFLPAPVSGTGVIAHTLVGGDLTGMHNGNETVGYLYPTTGLQVIVTNPSGTVSKPIDVETVSAGKNYFITIYKPSNDSDLEFDVEFGGWEEMGEGVGEPDFTPEAPEEILPEGDPEMITPAYQNGASLPHGLSAKWGALVLPTSPVENRTVLVETGVSVQLASIFPGNPELIGNPQIVDEENNEITPEDFVVSRYTDKAIRVKALFNYHNHRTYPVIFYAKVDEGTTRVIKKYRFKVTLNGMQLPANYSTKFNGLDVMSVGLSGSSSSQVEQINRFGSADKSFIENYKNYGSLYATTGTAYSGEEIHAGINTMCPKGFMLPSRAQLTQLLGGVMKYGDASIPLPAGETVNLGNTTTATYTTGGIAPYYILSDGTNELLFASNDVSLASKDGEVSYASKVRITFYHGAIGVTRAALTTASTNVRCIKVPQPSIR